MNLVQGHLVGLNAMFQSNSFKLHLLLPEVERVIRMFGSNFTKRGHIKSNIQPFQNESNWIQLYKVYLGILASNC